MVAFGVLFAVLQAMAGLTMYQQCTRLAVGQNVETVLATLKVALAFGILAFGFACRHIYLGVPTEASRDATALVIAIESFIIINFILTLFCHYEARKHAWEALPENREAIEKKQKPTAFGIVQTVLAIILFGLLAAEAQALTADSESNPRRVGLNAAGVWMLGFGLIFAVFEAIAGFTMIEQMTKKLHGSSPNAVLVTNKVAVAVGFLAMGFACRHIHLFLKFGAPSESPEESVRLVHAIEAFLIINAFVSWFIQMGASKVEW
jgi:hypothetical protein